MSRHTKNNCASTVFTYHERQRLQYGTRKAMLSKESLKQWDECCICLHTGVDPMCWYAFITLLLCVSCLFVFCSQEGHLFCKECVYEYLVNQKKELEKAKKIWELQGKQKQVPNFPF